MSSHFRDWRQKYEAFGLLSQILKLFKGRVGKMGKENGEFKEYEPLLRDFKEPVQQIKVWLK